MRFSPWTLSLLVVLNGGVALADPLPIDLVPQSVPSESVTVRAVKLRDLAVREEGPEPPPASEHSVDRFQTAKGGFKYQDNLTIGGKRYRYSLRGPVQQNKRFGLTFEFRF